MTAHIHPSAFVASTAQLGSDLVVGPCACIEDDVVIGNGCRIDAFASVKRYTRMGERNHIHSYALVGGQPQDLKFHGEESCLILGDDNQVREFATIHRGTEGGGGITKIGNANLLMAYIHVAHDCQLGSNIVMSNNATLAGHCHVGDYAILAGLCAVHQFSRIGEHSFLGGMSGANQDLPPWMMAVGSPHAGIVSPNLVGLRRAKVSMETVSAMKQLFRTIWHSRTPRKEALEQLEQQYSHLPQVQSCVDFIRTSPRGVMGAAHAQDRAE